MLQHLSTAIHPSLPAAVALAHASSRCYAPASGMKKWAQKNGFSGGAACFSRSDVQGFWCMQGNVALLAFRGSENIVDWIRNFQAMRCQHPWGMVHQGFSDGVKDVEPNLQQFAAAARNAEHVWATGHSLGGALAVMAAAWLKMHGIAATVYTFGQPAAVSDDFAQRFAFELPGRYVRFVNQNDIVPQIPPFYRHFGIMKRIVRPRALKSILCDATKKLSPKLTKKALVVQDAIGKPCLAGANAVQLLIDADLSQLAKQEFFKLQKSLGAAYADLKLKNLDLKLAFPSVSDHGISEYIRLLTEIRDQNENCFQIKHEDCLAAV